MELIEIVPDNCVGCRLCEMVCSLYHEGECSTVMSRIRIVRDEEFGNNLVSLCMQCEDAECIASCNYDAIIRDEKTGAVLVDEALCTACGDCVPACPLGAIYLPEGGRTAFKCDLCGGDPECVKICSRKALVIADVDPASKERKSFKAETAELLRQV